MPGVRGVTWSRFHVKDTKYYVRPYTVQFIRHGDLCTPRVLGMKLLHNEDSYITTCLESVVVTERTDYSLACSFDKQHRDFLRHHCLTCNWHGCSLAQHRTFCVFTIPSKWKWSLVTAEPAACSCLAHEAKFILCYIPRSPCLCFWLPGRQRTHNHMEVYVKKCIEITIFWIDSFHCAIFGLSNGKKNFSYR